jgi:hypothetical protein
MAATLEVTGEGQQLAVGELDSAYEQRWRRSHRPASLSAVLDAMPGREQR